MAVMQTILSASLWHAGRMHLFSANGAILMASLGQRPRICEIKKIHKR
jgi:hypothetical protein